MTCVADSTFRLLDERVGWDPRPIDGLSGVTIVDVYVEADGGRLGHMAERLGNGEVGISVGGTYGLAEGAEALKVAVGGGGGSAVVLHV